MKLLYPLIASFLLIASPTWAYREEKTGNSIDIKRLVPNTTKGPIDIITARQINKKFGLKRIEYTQWSGCRGAFLQRKPHGSTQ